jgi:hypothetical protein
LGFVFNASMERINGRQQAQFGTHHGKNTGHTFKTLLIKVLVLIKKKKKKKKKKLIKLIKKGLLFRFLSFFFLLLFQLYEICADISHFSFSI